MQSHSPLHAKFCFTKSRNANPHGVLGVLDSSFTMHKLLDKQKQTREDFALTLVVSTPSTGFSFPSSSPAVCSPSFLPCSSFTSGFAGMPLSFLSSEPADFPFNPTTELSTTPFRTPSTVATEDVFSSTKFCTMLLNSPNNLTKSWITERYGS